MDRVPSIDLTPFRLGADRQPVVDAVRAACEQIGFLVISGHGIDEALLAEAFAQSRAFFDQPLPDKRRAGPPIARRQRGYHEIASRNLGKTMGADVPPDLRESFFFGPIDDHRADYADMAEATESYAPNVLPEAPPRFTPTMIALYRSFERLSRRSAAHLRLRARAAGAVVRRQDRPPFQHHVDAPLSAADRAAATRPVAHRSAYGFRSDDDPGDDRCRRRARSADAGWGAGPAWLPNRSSSSSIWVT